MVNAVFVEQLQDIVGLVLAGFPETDGAEDGQRTHMPGLAKWLFLNCIHGASLQNMMKRETSKFIFHSLSDSETALKKNGYELAIRD